MQDAARAHRHHSHRASKEGSQRLRKVLPSWRRSLLHTRVLATENCVSVPISFLLTLFRRLFSVLSSACLKCEIASRVFQPGESFLCDSENGWIVCSSSHHGHTALLQLLIRSSFNKRRCGQTSGADTGILSRRLSRYIFRFTFITFNCLLLPLVEMPVCCLDLIQLIINVTEERRNVFLCKCRLLLLLNSLSLPRDHMVLCCLDVKMM